MADDVDDLIRALEKPYYSNKNKNSPDNKIFKGATKEEINSHTLAPKELSLINHDVNQKSCNVKQRKTNHVDDLLNDLEFVEDEKQESLVVDALRKQIDTK